MTRYRGSLAKIALAHEFGADLRTKMASVLLRGWMQFIDSDAGRSAERRI